MFSSYFTISLDFQSPAEPNLTFALCVVLFLSVYGLCSRRVMPHCRLIRAFACKNRAVVISLCIKDHAQERDGAVKRKTQTEEEQHAATIMSFHINTVSHRMKTV